MGGDGNLYIPRGALVAAVRGLKDYQGLSGMVACDATGECASSSPVFDIVKDGQVGSGGEVSRQSKPLV